MDEGNKREKKMRITMQFSMDDPDEQDEMYTHLNGPAYSRSLLEVDKYCRNRLKYNSSLDSRSEDLLSTIREIIRDTTKDTPWQGA